MSTNAFNCLSNALLQAGLKMNLPVLHEVPARVRELLLTEGSDVSDVLAVVLRQSPMMNMRDTAYRIDVYMKKGLPRVDNFTQKGWSDNADTFVMYDRSRDGKMQHLHLTH